MNMLPYYIHNTLKIPFRYTILTVKRFLVHKVHVCRCCKKRGSRSILIYIKKCPNIISDTCVIIFISKPFPILIYISVYMSYQIISHAKYNWNVSHGTLNRPQSNSPTTINGKWKTIAEFVAITLICRGHYIRIPVKYNIYHPPKQKMFCS